jgi:hypothetical protein
LQAFTIASSETFRPATFTVAGLGGNFIDFEELDVAKKVLAALLVDVAGVVLVVLLTVARSPARNSASISSKSSSSTFLLNFFCFGMQQTMDLQIGKKGQ